MNSELQPQDSALRQALRKFYDTRAGNTVFNVAGIVQTVSLVVLGLTVLYLALAVFTGQLAQVGASAGAAARFQWVGIAFLYACIGLTLALVARNCSDDTLIVVLGIAGAVVYFGLPMGLGMAMARGGASGGAAENAAVRVLTHQFMFLGFFLFSVTALRVCVFAADRILTTSSRDEVPSASRDFIARQISRPIKPNAKTRRGPFARCWEQPHCIDFIREVCRPWAERRACWRIQSGCMCDVRYLYDAMRKDETMGVRADQGMDDLIPEASEMGGGGHERRLYCRDCRIYLEHQRRKFRVLSPLSVPITAVIMLAASPIIMAIYGLLVQWSGRAIQTMWLGDNRDEVAGRFVNDLGNQGAAYAAIVLCGIFLLSAVMRFIEWLTLELKV